MRDCDFLKIKICEYFFIIKFVNMIFITIIFLILIETIILFE